MEALLLAGRLIMRPLIPLLIGLRVVGCGEAGEPRAARGLYMAMTQPGGRTAS
jgi:hypothetical protein